MAQLNHTVTMTDPLTRTERIFYWIISHLPDAMFPELPINETLAKQLNMTYATSPYDAAEPVCTTEKALFFPLLVFMLLVVATRWIRGRAMRYRMEQREHQKRRQDERQHRAAQEPQEPDNTRQNHPAEERNAPIWGRSSNDREPATQREEQTGNAQDQWSGELYRELYHWRNLAGRLQKDLATQEKKHEAELRRVDEAFAQDMQACLERFEEDLEYPEKIILELEEAARKKVKEHDEALQMLDEAEETIEHLYKELEETKKKTDDEKKAVGHAEMGLKKTSELSFVLQKKLEDANREVEELKKTLHQAKLVLTKANEEKAEAETELREALEASSEYLTKVEEVERQYAQVYSLQLELSGAADNLKAEQHRYEKLESKSDELMEQNSGLEAAQMHLLREIQKSQQENDALCSKIEVSKQEAKVLRQENIKAAENYEDTLTMKEAELNRKIGEMEELKAQHNSLVNESLSNEAAQHLRKQLEDERAAHKTDLQTAEMEWKEAIHDMREELEKHQEEKKQLLDMMEAEYERKLQEQLYDERAAHKTDLQSVERGLNEKHQEEKKQLLDVMEAEYERKLQEQEARFSSNKNTAGGADEEEVQAEHRLPEPVAKSWADQVEDSDDDEFSLEIMKEPRPNKIEKANTPRSPMVDTPSGTSASTTIPSQHADQTLASKREDSQFPESPLDSPRETQISQSATSTPAAGSRKASTFMPSKHAPQGNIPDSPNTISGSGTVSPEKAWKKGMKQIRPNSKVGGVRKKFEKRRYSEKKK